MTDELIKVLSDLCDTVEDWNKRVIPTEDEFLTKLAPLSKILSIEFRKSRDQGEKGEEIAG
jgi:hypothetical protein